MVRRAFRFLGLALARAARWPERVVSDNAAIVRHRKAVYHARSPEQVAKYNAAAVARYAARSPEQVAKYNAAAVARYAARSPEKVASDKVAFARQKKAAYLARSPEQVAKYNAAAVARYAARTPEQVVKERLLRKGYKKRRREIDKASRRAKLLP